MVKNNTYEAVLMNSLNFDENDLNFNDQGLLSELQLDALRGQRNLHGMVTVALMAVFIVCLRVFGMYLLSLELCFMTLIFGSLGVLVLYVAFTGWFNAYQDVKKGRAEMVEGYTTIDIKSAYKNGVYYVVNVKGVEFRVDKRVFLAFKNGEPYRVFYAPNTKKLLSAEWLR